MDATTFHSIRSEINSSVAALETVRDNIASSCELAYLLMPSRILEHG